MYRTPIHSVIVVGQQLSTRGYELMLRPRNKSNRSGRYTVYTADMLRNSVDRLLRAGADVCPIGRRDIIIKSGGDIFSLSQLDPR